MYIDPTGQPISQGDVFDDCPPFGLDSADNDVNAESAPQRWIGRVILLTQLGRRLGRVDTPYREHLNQHFAQTYARIGLPEPYESKE